MYDSLSISELERILKNILESRRTTIALDTNTFKPFCGIEIPGLDLTELQTPILNGYNIPGLIIKQRLYNREAAQAARYIQANNITYIDLLSDSFERYNNLVLPIQVKQELENWIKTADIEGYEKWAEGQKRPFRSKKMNLLVRIRGRNQYFAIIFKVQHEYKIAMKKFLENVPRGHIVDYSGNDRLSELIEQLSNVKTNNKDKQIFGNSYLATSDNGDKTLKIVSFDGGMIRIAKAFDKNGLGKGIETDVHYGYSLVRYRSPKRVIGLRLNRVYPTATNIQAA